MKKRRLNEHAFFSAILMGILALFFFFFVKQYMPEKIERHTASLHPTRPSMTVPRRTSLASLQSQLHSSQQENVFKKFPRHPLQTGIEQASLLFPITPSGPIDPSSLFSLSPLIQEAVNFWKNIYAYYSVDHVVIHDARKLGVIYTAIDFGPLNNQGLTEWQKQKMREERISQEIEKTKNIIEDLSLGTPPITPKEKYIANLLHTHFPPDTWDDIKERVRFQTGLRERFQQAIEKSGLYLSQMKKYFF